MDPVIITGPESLHPSMMTHAHGGNLAFCPPGMEYLLDTSMILVRQMVEVLEVLANYDSNNKYEVLDVAGRRIYLAAEVSECCTRWFCGSRRTFTIILLNNNGGVALKVHRKCSCCYFCCCGNFCNTLEVFTGSDVYVGKITQNIFSFCCPEFTVWDAEGNKRLKISGPCAMCLCCSVHFKIYNYDDGVEIGEIHKKWAGVVKEAFTTADTFGVSFPVDLDPRLKTLLLGSVFLIDFMYFEHKDNN